MGAGSAGERTIGRRRFLGAAVMGGVGVVGARGARGNATIAPGLVRVGSVNERLNRVARERSGPDRRVVTYQQAIASTPDGFLPTSIGGVFLASRPSSFVVAAGQPMRPVAVAITPSTLVWAGGMEKQGDLSGCSVGDSLFAETAFSSNGGRVALWVETNLAVYWGTIAGVSENTLTVTTSDYGSGQGATLDIQIVSMTLLSSTPTIGQSIYCVAGTESPDPANPGLIWGRYVETWNAVGSWS